MARKGAFITVHAAAPFALSSAATKLPAARRTQAICSGLPTECSLYAPAVAGGSRSARAQVSVVIAWRGLMLGMSASGLASRSVVRPDVSAADTYRRQAPGGHAGVAG